MIPLAMLTVVVDVGLKGAQEGRFGRVVNDGLGFVLGGSDCLHCLAQGFTSLPPAWIVSHVASKSPSNEGVLMAKWSMSWFLTKLSSAVTISFIHSRGVLFLGSISSLISIMVQPLCLRFGGRILSFRLTLRVNK